MIERKTSPRTGGEMREIMTWIILQGIVDVRRMRALHRFKANTSYQANVIGRLSPVM